MSQAVVCCQTIAGVSRSPFETTALGWYDGLTEGMAACRSCGRAYHFELVAWDEGRVVRVYGFSSVNADAYEAFIAHETVAPPSPDTVQENIDKTRLLVRDALATSYERALYVAATDLSKEVLAARRLQFPDWRSLLGIPGTPE